MFVQEYLIIKIGPKGALGSHEIRPIHSAPSLGQSIITLWDYYYRLLMTRIIFNNILFFVVGGSEQFRPYWGNFYDGTDVLVFVVDSADLHALSLAVREVASVLSDQRLAKVPVVVVAHKQDLPGAMLKDEVSLELKMRSKKFCRPFV